MTTLFRSDPRGIRAVTAGVACLGTLIATAAAAEARPQSEPTAVAQGSETLVNTTTIGDQYFPALATNKSGLTLVAWTDTSELSGGHSHGGPGGHVVIRARVVDRSGTPVGEDIEVAGGEGGNRVYPTVAALDNGNFAVGYLRAVPGGLNEVWTQVVGSDGLPVGEPVLVSEEASSVQFAPSSSTLPGNRYVLAWTGSSAADRSDWDAKARVLRFDGRPVTGELRLNEVATGRQSRPTVTAVRGGFVAAWTDASLSKDTSISGITGRSFTPDGTSLTSDVQLNDVTAGGQARPSLTTLASGRIAAAWEDSNITRDGAGSAVVGRTFTADLALGSTEWVLNTATAGNQQKPRVSAAADGGWIVVWEDSSRTDDPVWLGIRGRVLPGTGEPVGSDFPVNTATADNQQQPAVAHSHDRAIVVWTDESHAFADSHRTGVVARAFNVASR